MKNRNIKKVWAGITVVLAMAIVTVMVQAQDNPSQAPPWWDNPGGVYTTWSQFTTIGDASTDPGNTQAIVISNDLLVCQEGATRDVWIQIGWNNTGNNDVTFLTGVGSRTILWAVDPINCPATIDDPFDDADDFANLINVGVYDHATYENGYERRFTFPDTTAACARIETRFNLPGDAGLEYQVEVQAVCVTPTAVNLGNFTAVSNTVNNLPQAMGVVALLLLALLSFGFVIVRRQSAQV